MRPCVNPRRKQFTVVALVLGAATGFGCASSSADTGELPQSTPSATGGGSTSIVDGGLSRGGKDGGKLDKLCGNNFNCLNRANPDDVLACKDFQGSGRPTDAGFRGVGGASSGGSSGTGGIVSSGGTAGSHRDGGAGEAGAPRDGSAGGLDASDASDARGREGGSPKDVSLDRTEDHSSPGFDTGTIGAGGASNSGQPDGNAPPVVDAGLRYSCQVSLPPTSGAAGSTSSEPFSQCLPAGDRKSGSPCLSSADCRPGLACAGPEKGASGQCLPYCCDPTTSCERAWIAGGGSGADSGSNLYCGRRSLIDGSQKSTLIVPVCVPADRCKLGEPYPCTAPSCICKDGTACTVAVTQDAGYSVGDTTYCAVPGTGHANESCSASKPCAAGYFCSESRGVCLKMCSTDGFGATCAPGRCQQSVGFPDGWGVCVGAVPASR